MVKTSHIFPTGLFTLKQTTMRVSKSMLLAFLGSLLMVTFAISSCSKSGDGNDDGPNISSITPSSGLTGTTINVKGEGLLGVSVTIGGISVPVSNASSTSFTTEIPSGAMPGSNKVVVSNSRGSDKANIQVTGAGSAPVITSISPSQVSLGGTIIITGTGLSGALVEIATKVSTVNNNTATSISAKVPASGIALGSASVRVTTSLGTVVSSVTIQ